MTALSPAASPTDGLVALAVAARAAKVAAAGLRWLAACAIAFAGLLLLALALASFERGGGEPAAASASAYLDFDLSVLRALADRSLADPDDGALPALWRQRPDWRLPQERSAQTRLVSPRDAWAAVVSGKSRFRTAARGAADALPLLLGALALALFAAGLAGGLSQARGRTVPVGKKIIIFFLLGGVGLVLVPLWPLFDAALFYDRTRSLGTGLYAALFVAAFAGALPCAAARALMSGSPQARNLAALGGRPAFPAAVRLAVLDATGFLVPLVPALAAAAVFACAKADQDPGVHGTASGLGALIRSALRETSAGERLSSGALVGGGLLLLFWLGHRFLLEVREALAARGAP